MKQTFTDKKAALAYVDSQIKKHADIAQQKLGERTAYVDGFIENYQQGLLVRIGLKKPVLFPEKKLENATCRYVTVRTMLRETFMRGYDLYVNYQQPWEQAVKRCEEWLQIERALQSSEASSWEFYL